MFIQHELVVCFNNESWYETKHTFCLPVLKYSRQCVELGLLEFVLLISKLDYHPLNEMVIKPLFNILCLSLILAGQFLIAGENL